MDPKQVFTRGNKNRQDNNFHETKLFIKVTKNFKMFWKRITFLITKINKDKLKIRLISAAYSN